MDQSDWLFYVEFGGVYSVLLGFAAWEVIKMRRHAKKREAEKKAETEDKSVDHQN